MGRLVEWQVVTQVRVNVGTLSQNCFFTLSKRLFLLWLVVFISGSELILFHGAVLPPSSYYRFCPRVILRTLLSWTLSQ